MGKASNSEQTQHKQNNANRWRLPIKSLVHKTNVWFVGLAQLSSQFLYTTHTPQATSSVLADTALKQLLLLPSLLPQNIIVGFCSKMLKLSQRLIKLFFRNIQILSENAQWIQPLPFLLQHTSCHCGRAASEEGHWSCHLSLQVFKETDTS